MTTYHLPADNDVPPLREQVGTVVIGAVAGLAAVAFHAVMNLAESVRTELAVFATAHGMAAQFGVILTCGVLAATAVFLVHRFANEAEGSVLLLFFTLIAQSEDVELLESSGLNFLLDSVHFLLACHSEEKGRVSKSVRCLQLSSGSSELDWYISEDGQLNSVLLQV